MPELVELTRDEWEEYLERLTLYAAKKFLYKGWIAKGGERTGPQGKAPEDIAYEAVLKVLNGERQYNREAYSDFMHFMRSIVDSLVSHLAKSFESKRFKPMPVATTDQGDCEEFEFEGKEPAPARTCIHKDLAKKVETILTNEFKGDLVLAGILECFKADVTKPSEMALLLEVDIKEIYNAQKRLQRVIEKKLQNLKMEYRR